METITFVVPEYPEIEGSDYMTGDTARTKLLTLIAEENNYERNKDAGPILDENGDQVYEFRKDENGDDITEQEIPVWETDENGDVVYQDNDMMEPVQAVDGNGDPITEIIQLTPSVPSHKIMTKVEYGGYVAMQALDKEIKKAWRNRERREKKFDVPKVTASTVDILKGVL